MADTCNFFSHSLNPLQSDSHLDNFVEITHVKATNDLITNSQIDSTSNYLFIWKVEKEREREREKRRSSNSLLTPLNVQNSQDVVRPKSKARTSLQVSHVGGKVPCMLAIVCCLPGASAERWIGSIEYLGVEQMSPNGMQLNLLHHNVCPLTLLSLHFNSVGNSS